MEDVHTKKAKKGKRAKSCTKKGAGQSCKAAACSGDTAGSKEEKEDRLSLITWNVDGRDVEQQQDRAAALCHHITQYSPDVAFLQDVIPSMSLLLHKSLSANYTIIEGGKKGYFTMMLLKKSRITLEKSGIVAFPATHMMRNLLVARVLFKGQKFCLMTSHFESYKSNSAERKRQLRLVTMRINKACDDVTVLFGGDTNLTDSEVAEVGLPSGVCDVWEKLGRPQGCRYTWDTETNTNLDMQSKCRFRFARVYLRPATMDRVPRLEPDSMALIGLEKLTCGRFISHHWGIYCTFSAVTVDAQKNN